MTRQDKFDELSQAKDRLHKASDELIKIWEPILKERKRKALGEEYKMSNLSRAMIFITDYIVRPYEFDYLEDYHKVCLWGRN